MEQIDNLHRFTGRGIFVYPDDNEFEGEFVNGFPDGKGVMRFSNNDRYEGDWHNGEMEGYGIYKFYDEKKDKYIVKYEGNFHKSTFEGEGKITYANRSVYYGFWTAGQRNGMGQLLLNDGTLLSGIWQSDHLSEGVAIMPDGQRYCGGLGSDYRFHGWGTLFSPDGSWTQGEWSEGEFVKGNAFSANGTCHVFENGKQISEQEW